MIYLDLDDFYESNTALDTLTRLKQEIPQFKVTLFTILGRCSYSFIQQVKAIEWIDMVPHGFMHETSRECEHWTYAQAKKTISWFSQFGITRGFKAPGWQISDGTYSALLDLNYWVADQSYNNIRRPKDLPAYLLDIAGKIHGHIGHLGGHNENELSLLMPELLKLKDKEFGFVKDTF